MVARVCPARPDLVYCHLCPDEDCRELLVCPEGRSWLAGLPATVDRAAVLAELAPSLHAWHEANR